MVLRCARFARAGAPLLNSLRKIKFLLKSTCENNRQPKIITGAKDSKHFNSQLNKEITKETNPKLVKTIKFSLSLRRAVFV